MTIVRLAQLLAASGRPPVMEGSMTGLAHAMSSWIPHVRSECFVREAGIGVLWRSCGSSGLLSHFLK